MLTRAEKSEPLQTNVAAMENKNSEMPEKVKA